MQNPLQSEAIKLEQDLQRQFADRRRQTMVVKGLHPNLEMSSETPRLAAKVAPSGKGEFKDKKIARLSRRHRLQGQKRLRALAKKSRPDGQPASVAPQDSIVIKDAEKPSSKNGDNSTGNKGAARVPKRAPARKGTRTGTGDADLAKLFSEVGKLKEALAVEGSGKRVLEAESNGPGLYAGVPLPESVAPKIKKVLSDNPKALSTSSEGPAPPTLRIRKLASDSPKTSSMLDDKSAQSTDVLTAQETLPGSKSPAATSDASQPPPTAPSKTRNGEAAQKHKLRVKKVARSLEPPSRTKARKNVAIEAVNATDLEITGKYSRLSSHGIL